MSFNQWHYIKKSEEMSILCNFMSRDFTIYNSCENT